MILANGLAYLARRRVRRGPMRLGVLAAVAPLVLAFLLTPTAPAWAVPAEALKYYDDAVERLERNDIAGAIIQLNNALQKDANLLAAHVLLGKARMRNSDPANAETSFNTALRLGADRAEVALPLAQAYLAQRKFDALLERVVPDGLPRSMQVEILVLRGNALAEKDDTAEALRSFEKARALDPQSMPVRLAEIKMLIRRDQLARAEGLLDEAVKLAPNDTEVWNLRGRLTQLKKDATLALEYYARAVALDPKNLEALLAEAGLLLDLSRLEEGEKALNNLKEVAPRDPQAAFLRAVLAKRKGDEDAVRKELGYAVTVVDRLPRQLLDQRNELMLLGGLAHHGLGNLEKAAQYLTLYVRSNPKQTGPAKILASIYIDRGDIGRAIQLLNALETALPNDPHVLSLLAAAHMAERRYSKAAALLERAVKASGGDSDARVNLGVSLVAGGQDELGFSQLQQVFMKDSSQTRPGFVLATLLLKREQPKKAVEVIDIVVKRDPKNPAALNLQGIAHVTAGDRAGGREAYKKALTIDPDLYSARLNVARLDMVEGKWDAARNGLIDLLKRNSKDGEVMLELARMEERIGRPAEAAKWLEHAATIPDHRVAAEVQLSALHLRQRDFDQALAVAKSASSRAPNDIAPLLALSRAQLAKEDRGAAKKTLAIAAPLASFNAGQLLEIARMQVAAGDREGAYRNLEKALEGETDHLGSLALLTEMEIVDGRHANAEQHARRLTERYQTQGIGPRLMGDVLAARGQRAAAIASYKSALAKEKSAITVVHLHDVMVTTEGRAKALAFLEQWHRENPNDYMILRAQADARADAGNLVAARKDYERLLARAPNDVEVLNNIAQVAARQKDSAALGYAERAYKLAGSRAAVVDTLGWILIQQGELQRGTDLLREARLRDAANPEIRYHLAVALAKAGREAEARSELLEGLKEGAAYEGIEEARLLQRKLGP